MAEEIVVSESERCGTSGTVCSSYQPTPLTLAPLLPLLKVRRIYDKKKAVLTFETRIQDRLSLRASGSQSNPRWLMDGQTTVDRCHEDSPRDI